MAVSTGVAAAVRPPREYELTYILRPQTTPSDAEKVSSRITEVIDRFDGRLTKVDNWGKRRLAYPMSKHTRGVYLHVWFVARGDVVVELERNLRILDPVIRFMTVQKEAEVDVARLEVDPEEVAFQHLEVTEDEEDENLEQRLGLAPPPSRVSDEGELDEMVAAEPAAPAPAPAPASDEAAPKAGNDDAADTAGEEGQS